MRKFFLLVSMLVFAIFASVSLVSAEQPEDHYTYDATSNYHGIDVPLGATVIVTATTDDPNVNSVLFIWRNGAGMQQWNETVTINSGLAQSSGQPDSIGDWGVQTLFIGPGGTTKEEVDFVIAIRATSFNVVPEVPILGTAGIVGAMALGLTIRAKRKNN